VDKASERCGPNGNWRQDDAGEDDSRGYALSNERTLRAKQLAMHAYALSHRPTLERALQTCGKPEHRRAAAEIHSYGKESEAQISDLVRASRIRTNWFAITR